MQSFREWERGFSLIELVIYVAIFSIVSITFIGILIVVTRVQVRQSAASEVASQSQQLLQTIQRNVDLSYLLEMPKDVATSTIRLRMYSVADPTLIFPSGTAMWIKQGGNPAIQLTSDRVQVSTSTFVRRTNPPGRDTLNVNFTIRFNTSNPQQQYTTAIDTAFTRTTVAKFDSSLHALSGARIGATGREWASVNDTMFFGTNTVGFGPTPFLPRARVQVEQGSVYLDQSGAYISTNSGLGWCRRFNIDGSNNLAFATSTVCP